MQRWVENSRDIVQNCHIMIYIDQQVLINLQDEGEGTQAKVEADNFVDKFKQAYENEQFEEVLDLFVSKFDSVCQVAENDHGTSRIKYLRVYFHHSRLLRCFVCWEILSFDFRFILQIWKEL